MEQTIDVVDELTDAEGKRLVGADRVLAVMIALAEHPHGVSLDDLSRQLSSSKSTVHRALTSLRRAGLANQTSRGIYELGDEFLRLAFLNARERPDSAIIQPVLEQLVERYGETVHYAVLEGSEVVYRAKVDPPQGAVRLTSLIGGRNPAYRTAVGKLLLSLHVQSKAELTSIVGGGPFERKTENTITTVDELWAELLRIREQGFAVDDQENESGVNCLAVAAPPRVEATTPGAVSVSALAFRTPLDQLISDASYVRGVVAGRKSSNLTGNTSADI